MQRLSTPMAILAKSLTSGPLRPREHGQKWTEGLLVSGSVKLQNVCTKISVQGIEPASHRWISDRRSRWASSCVRLREGFDTFCVCAETEEGVPHVILTSNDDTCCRRGPHGSVRDAVHRDKMVRWVLVLILVLHERFDGS